MKRQRDSKLLIWIAVTTSLLAAGAATRATRARATTTFLETQRYEDIYYLPTPPVLRVLSVGYNEALADLIWIRSLLYFGEELHHRGRVRYIQQYGEAMLALDPQFRRVYRWVGMGSLYRTGHVTMEDMKRAIAFLERGASRFPDDGDLAWDVGGTLSFELAPLLQPGPEKDSVKQRGVEYLMRAARLGAGPPWLTLTNAAQLRRLGKTELAVRHLEEMYDTTRDPNVREQIARNIAHLRSQAEAEAFRRANIEFEQNRRREYPYLPPSLYMLIGPRVESERRGLLQSAPSTRVE